MSPTSIFLPLISCLIVLTRISYIMVGTIVEFLILKRMFLTFSHL